MTQHTAQKKQKYTYTIPTLADRGKMIEYIRMECTAHRQLTDLHLYKTFKTQYAIERLIERGYLVATPENGEHTYRFTDYELNAEDIAADVWKRSGTKQLRITKGKQTKLDLPAAPETNIVAEVPAAAVVTKEQVQAAMVLIEKYQIQDAAGFIADHLNKII